MWIIAQRTFVQNWRRLIATSFAIGLSVALISGTIQFVQRAQRSINGTKASETLGADFVVKADSADGDAFAVPESTLSLKSIEAVAGIRAVHGETRIPVSLLGNDSKPVRTRGGGNTLLHPWVADPKLSRYQLVAGRAPRSKTEVVLGQRLAEAGSLTLGSHTKLVLPQAVEPVQVVGIATVQNSGYVITGDLVLMESKTVSEIGNLQPGEWPIVWVQTNAQSRGAASETVAAMLRSAAGTSSVVRSASKELSEQSATLQAASGSIGGGLGIMGILAVVVGVFVVCNTFSTLIRQRQRQLALLIAIGASDRQIKRLVRLEAVVLGLAGSVSGAIIGNFIAIGFTKVFAKSALDVSNVPLPFGVLNIAIALIAGLLTTQMAARAAAKRACKVSPLDALRSSTAEVPIRSKKRFVGVVLLSILGCLMIIPMVAIRSDTSINGVDRAAALMSMTTLAGMIFVCVLGLLSPFFIGPVGGLVGLVAQRLSGESGRIARMSIVRNPRRVASAASLLMVAVCLGATPLLIINSVFARFVQAGKSAVVATAVVSPSANGTESSLPVDLEARIKTVPGVSAAASLFRLNLRVISPLPKVAAVDGIDSGPPVGAALLNLGGLDSPKTVLTMPGLPGALRDGELAVGRSRMRTSGWRVGDTVVVRGANGPVSLKIVTTYFDPTHLIVDEAVVNRATMLSINPSATVRALFVVGEIDAVKAALRNDPTVAVQNRSQFIVDQRRRVINGIELIFGFIGMAILISLFGMGTTLSLNVFERTKEFGLLGAIGATKSKIEAVVYWEAATVIVTGLGLGLFEAFAIVELSHIVTGSTFISIGRPLPVVIGALMIAILLTVVMSILPARRASGVAILDAVRVN